MACKLVGAIAIKWYKILGYIGPNAIKQLPKYVNGVELTNKRAPLKIKCEVCLLAKYI
jgi:archaellum component FlaD/FlaE